MYTIFKSINEARELKDDQETKLNEERYQDALNELTLWEYLSKHELVENSNYRYN